MFLIINLLPEVITGRLKRKQYYVIAILVAVSDLLGLRLSIVTFRQQSSAIPMKAEINKVGILFLIMASLALVTCWARIKIKMLNAIVPIVNNNFIPSYYNMKENLKFMVNI